MGFRWSEVQILSPRLKIYNSAGIDEVPALLAFVPSPLPIFSLLAIILLCKILCTHPHQDNGGCLLCGAYMSVVRVFSHYEGHRASAYVPPAHAQATKTLLRSQLVAKAENSVLPAPASVQVQVPGPFGPIAVTVACDPSILSGPGMMVVEGVFLRRGNGGFLCPTHRPAIRVAAAAIQDHKLKHGMALRAPIFLDRKGQPLICSRGLTILPDDWAPAPVEPTPRGASHPEPSSADTSAPTGAGGSHPFEPVPLAESPSPLARSRPSASSPSLQSSTGQDVRKVVSGFVVKGHKCMIVELPIEQGTGRRPKIRISPEAVEKYQLLGRAWIRAHVSCRPNGRPIILADDILEHLPPQRLLPTGPEKEDTPPLPEPLRPSIPAKTVRLFRI